MFKAFPASAAWLETNWQVLNLTMMNVLFVMLVLWAISMMQTAEHTETEKKQKSPIWTSATCGKQLQLETPSTVGTWRYTFFAPKWKNILLDLSSFLSVNKVALNASTTTCLKRRINPVKFSRHAKRLSKKGTLTCWPFMFYVMTNNLVST